MRTHPGAGPPALESRCGPEPDDLMFAFIDPYLSLMTDEVAEGTVAESQFRRSIVWLTGSRVAGTLAQIIRVPASLWIVVVADWL